MEIARPFGFPITNSMVVTWIVAIALIVFAQVATRRMTQVPGGAQNFLEWMIESLHNFLESILGPHLVQRTFWFFATVFIFILTANWIGLLPGAGTIGWGHQTPHGFDVDQPLLRGVNADLNMTLAMSIIFFALWFIWALQANGPGGVSDRIRPGRLRRDRAVMIDADALQYSMAVYGVTCGIAIVPFDSIQPILVRASSGRQSLRSKAMFVTRFKANSNCSVSVDLIGNGFPLSDVL
jgi:hypothetical protein